MTTNNKNMKKEQITFTKDMTLNNFTVIIQKNINDYLYYEHEYELNYSKLINDEWRF